MSRPKVFFDTTILIYFAAGTDGRADVADQLLSEGGYLSVQVLNEFVSVAQRKLKLPWAEISSHLTSIRELCEPPSALTVDLHDRARAFSERYRYHIYDSLMLASALQSGCKTLYSEDMQDGQRIDALTIRNPFKT